MKKIAFCFATYENMSHPEIWEKFFAQADPRQYKILIHAKYPEAVTQDFVKSHFAPEHLDTAWGSIKACRLWQYMFSLAFQDPDVYKVINLTQSCIPIRSLSKPYEELTSTDKAFVDWVPVTPGGEHQRRRDKLKDPNFISIDEWVFHMAEGLCFTRELLDFFLKNDKTELFEDTFAPDEHYVSIMLIHYKKEDLVKRKKLHQCLYWGGGSHGGLKGITEDQVKEWRKEGRFFLRKFAPGASIPSMILEDE